MAIYYVNNSGSNTFPYDTVANGAINVKTLSDNISFADSDVIRFYADGGAINDYASFSYSSPLSLSKQLTFECYSTTGIPKCVWDLSSQDIIYLKTGCDNTTFDGIHFRFSTLALQYLFILYNDINNFTIKNCTITTDQNLMSQRSVIYGTNPEDSSYGSIFGLTIENNEFYNVKTLVAIFSAYTDILFNNNIITQTSYESDAYLFKLPNSQSLADCNGLIVSNNYIKNYGRCFSIIGSPQFPLYENAAFYNNTVDECAHFIYFLSVNLKTIEIYNNNITNVRTQAIVMMPQSTEVDIDSVSIYDNKISSGYSSAIAIFFSNDSGYGTFTNILIDNNNIDFSGSGTFAIHIGLANSNNVTIKRNYCTCVGQTLVFTGGTNDQISENTIIENNILNGNYPQINMGASLKSFVFRHNNVITNSATTVLMFATNSAGDEADFYDNIFYSAIPSILYVTNITANNRIFDYNCYYNVTVDFSNSIVGSIETSGNNNVEADPLWRDTASDDYYLKSLSPCISVGYFGANDDIGAIDYVDGVDFVIQDSVIMNLDNINNAEINLRLENNALNSDIRSEYIVSVDNNNQYDFVAPDNYPLAKDSIGYGEDLQWIIDYRSELAPFAGISYPPNPGFAWPDYLEYPVGLFGYSRLDGQ